MTFTYVSCIRPFAGSAGFNGRRRSLNGGQTRAITIASISLTHLTWTTATAATKRVIIRTETHAHTQKLSLFVAHPLRRDANFHLLIRTYPLSARVCCSRRESSSTIRLAFCVDGAVVRLVSFLYQCAPCATRIAFLFNTYATDMATTTTNVTPRPRHYPCAQYTHTNEHTCGARNRHSHTGASTLSYLYRGNL